MTPTELAAADITEAGWYLRYDEFVKIEWCEQPRYPTGIVRGPKSMQIGVHRDLICDGSIHRSDWGGPFFGPIDLSALRAAVPDPIGHDEAKAEIQQCFRRIEIIADAFGYDPSEWLVMPDDEPAAVPAGSVVVPPVTVTYVAFQKAFEAHPWYRRKIDGTPLSNDLAVIADRVMRELISARPKEG